jgi:peroxiredoxin
MRTSFRCFLILTRMHLQLTAHYMNQFAFGMKGVSKRAAFVIDEDQNVIYAEVLENAGDLPNFEAIAEKVK